MADQVGRDHRVLAREPRRNVLPVSRRVHHPVYQHQGRAAAGDPVDHPVPVQLDLPFLEVRNEGGSPRLVVCVQARIWAGTLPGCGRGRPRRMGATANRSLHCAVLGAMTSRCTRFAAALLAVALAAGLAAAGPALAKPHPDVGAASIAASVHVASMTDRHRHAKKSSSRSLKPYRGVGSWVDIYDPAAQRQPEAAVADMAARGVRTLYLETANFKQKRE